ncbi:MAG: hypothetical protein CSA05_02785 [Bacteroidia bacterium]|nr:MAG: hypothetical protein CSA05_02785 [Bacteroidia bacterium]
MKKMNKYYQKLVLLRNILAQKAPEDEAFIETNKEEMLKDLDQKINLQRALSQCQNQTKRKVA